MIIVTLQRSFYFHATLLHYISLVLLRNFIVDEKVVMLSGPWKIGWIINVKNNISCFLVFCVSCSYFFRGNCLLFTYERWFSVAELVCRKKQGFLGNLGWKYFNGHNNFKINRQDFSTNFFLKFSKTNSSTKQPSQLKKTHLIKSKQLCANI